jgi:hypothetical protein
LARSRRSRLYWSGWTKRRNPRPLAVSLLNASIGAQRTWSRAHLFPVWVAMLKK